MSILLGYCSLVHGYMGAAGMDLWRLEGRVTFAKHSRLMEAISNVL